MLAELGGGIFYKLQKKLIIPNTSNPRLVDACKFIAIGLASNLFKLLGGLGQFIGVISSGYFIKKGLDIIICLIFDEEPEEDGDLIDIATDIVTLGLSGGMGSLQVVISTCLKAFAKRLIEEKLIKTVSEMIEEQVKEVVKIQLAKVIKPICQELCQKRAEIYQTINLTVTDHL